MIDKLLDIRYFPTLRTRAAELLGLEKLDDKRKDSIIPLLTLGSWRGNSDLGKAAEKCVEAMGSRPFFMDLSADSRKAEDHWAVLNNSGESYEEWRNFASKYQGAIPVVLMPTGARTREVVQQAAAIEQTHGCVAFRIQDFSAHTPLVISAISALKNPSNAIVFVDCQYIRDAMVAYVTAAISTINRLREEFPSLLISVLSTSFPSSTLPFADASKQTGAIGIQERDFYVRVGGSPVAVYGDHGSIHAVVYDEVPIMRWSPRIDYPEYNVWNFERRSSTGIGNEAAYVECATALVRNFGETIQDSNIWGEQMILQASKGSPFAKAPAKWISVRVNIHLARQIDYVSAATQPEDDDDLI
ncbi:beta family protein [Comamonas testosteroni]|uniref:Beta family protein n=1 Tax=Comamonas thiooxydans TaxID=363952 RepID=A0AA42TT79_9BURK|nr:beta family protein [Comamonas thiooxydans]MDH1333514.1 beta family protein [Comamonas thiooxydans]MDH1738714.1 beta family protein [Comamonas thiooxydans]MDH1788253.1 beta family protein [Comamonas thiooxydans]